MSRLMQGGLIVWVILCSSIPVWADEAEDKAVAFVDLRPFVDDNNAVTCSLETLSISPMACGMVCETKFCHNQTAPCSHGRQPKVAIASGRVAEMDAHQLDSVPARIQKIDPRNIRGNHESSRRTAFRD